VYAAVAAAVQDAIGAPITATPITPARIWRASRVPESALGRVG
jgi:CO/xanthine dehydrogenase Mo-binding subunit